MQLRNTQQCIVRRAVKQSSFRASTLRTGTLCPGDIPDGAQPVDERFGPCAPLFRTLSHAEPLI